MLFYSYLFTFIYISNIYIYIFFLWPVFITFHVASHKVIHANKLSSDEVCDDGVPVSR